MRIYSYIPSKALIIAGVKGLYMHEPKGEVAKVLRKYIEVHPIEVKYPPFGTIKLSTRAVYGALVVGATPLEMEMAKDRYGVLVFFNIMRKYKYPIFLADYRPKAKILELLMFKENHEDIVSGKYKSVGEALYEYARAYWASVKPLRIALDEIRKDILERQIAGELWWNVRKVLMEREVLAYMNIPPEKLFVKGEGKKYAPFLLWLYAHRGFYLKAIREAKTELKKAALERLYSNFLARVREYEKKLGGRPVDASRGEIYYVFPSGR